VIRPIAAAVSFLTRIPLGRLRLDSADVGRGSLFFPLVGAGIGALVGLVAEGLAGLVTSFLAAAVAVAFEALLTGVIHFDALTDAADGLGARSRERALEVMRDPSIGTFGAVALLLDVLVKVGAIASLTDGGNAVWPLLAAFAIGRAAPLALGLALPYARPGSGSGRALTDGSTGARAGGLVLAAAMAAVTVGWSALALGAAAGGVVLLVGGVARLRLGGVTGDVLGAGTELTTTAALLAAAATA
jgi:cobalamin 5'-phosphate synthase/cobalamin synthase